jgi:nickel transport protein
LLTLLLLTLTTAHDLEVATRTAPPAAIVKATYAGADPVPFAKVQVFTPAGVEFQNANTDKNGSFSFVPDTTGAWRVVIDDELGHRRETTVNVASLEASGPSQPTSTSRIERALLGLSLILGLTGFWYGFQKRKQA